MSYPKQSLTKPTDLAGQTNGKLSTATLRLCDAYPNTKTARLHSLAKRAFDALDYRVKQIHGETLTTTSGADCYRTYTQQYNTFMKRYTTEPIPGRPTKQWAGQTWYLRPGYASAATPGNSNHGWGLARDTALWAGRVIGIKAAKAWPWLLAHAREFGIGWESDSEPWHVRYNTGDAVPQAVLDAEEEQANPDPPPGGGFDVNVTRTEIMKGSSGSDVKRLQMQLVALGYVDQNGAALNPDGQFGAKTEFATMAFQTDERLTVDGKVGPQTWGRIENKDLM